MKVRELAKLLGKAASCTYAVPFISIASAGIKEALRACHRLVKDSKEIWKYTVSITKNMRDCFGLVINMFRNHFSAKIGIKVWGANTCFS